MHGSANSDRRLWNPKRALSSAQAGLQGLPLAENGGVSHHVALHGIRHLSEQLSVFSARPVRHRPVAARVPEPRRLHKHFAAEVVIQGSVTVSCGG